MFSSPQRAAQIMNLAMLIGLRTILVETTVSIIRLMLLC
jgi:hypothetical protein